MNRLLSIVVTLFVLFLVYIWINHVVHSEVEPIITSDASNVESPAEIQRQVPKRDMASPIAEQTEVEQPQLTRPTEPLLGRSKEAIHLVIAGNFLERSNAEKMAQRLKRLGYLNSEVLRFELSEYHTVCAGRFDDASTARRYSKQLKESHAIDSYVRIAN